MEGWSEFQAIPTWFGILVVLIALARFIRRELAIRKQFLSNVDAKRGVYRTSDPTEVGYVVPKGGLSTKGESDWGYFLDADVKRRPTRRWWLFKAVTLFLQGRKRNPIEAGDYRLLGE